jgi:hypothetical protein
MRTPKLTRAQRRRLRKLADPIRRITQGDLNYFARFPDRRYRVREADIAEIEQMELTGSTNMNLPPGEQHYTAVLSLSPELCVGLPVRAPADLDLDLFTEEEVRALFRRCVRQADADGLLTQAELLLLIDAFK